MNCKAVCLFFLIISSAAYPAEKWNVLIADWKDLSGIKNKTVGLLIKKSIAAQLSKDPDFRVWVTTNGTLTPENAGEVMLQGITNRADVVVTGDYYFGNYYIQGEKLAVVVELYDVLNKRLKARKIYTGTISADIFDTIDTMTVDLKGTVEKEFPTIAESDEAAVRVKRNVVFKEENIKIPRIIYVRFGAYTEFGHIYVISGNNNSPPLSGEIPETSLLAGLAVRLWDFRLDVMYSGFPGVPVYSWNNSSIVSQMAISMNLVGLSYYLPWFDHKFAVGLGTQIQQDIMNYGNDQYGQTNFNNESPPYIPVSILLTWDPSEDLEISAAFLPEFWKMDWVNNQGSQSYQSSFQYNVPPVQLGVIKFFSGIGVEARVNFYWEVYNSNGNGSSDVTALGAYLGIVYRADFSY